MKPSKILPARLRSASYSTPVAWVIFLLNFFGCCFCKNPNLYVYFPCSIYFVSYIPWHTLYYHHRLVRSLVDVHHIFIDTCHTNKFALCVPQPPSWKCYVDILSGCCIYKELKYQHRVIIACRSMTTIDHGWGRPTVWPRCSRSNNHTLSWTSYGIDIM